MLQLYCFEVEAEVTVPLILEPYCGSAIRGAFFEGLWHPFCSNKEAKTCQECQFLPACPVSSIITPFRDAQPLPSHWRDMARPYIIYPPTKTNEVLQEYERGERFSFGLTLIGIRTILFPYTLRAFLEMERVGIGRSQDRNHGKRGHFRVSMIRAYHPFSQETQVLWKPGDKQPQKPTLCVTPVDVVRRAEQLSSDKVTFQFLSPTRLIENKRYLTYPDFHVLIQRLAERVDQLSLAYDHPEQPDTQAVVSRKERYLHVSEYARHVQLTYNDTHWVEVSSHSKRQNRRVPVGGIVGTATFEGNIGPLRELLVWGEIIGVGKNVTKGGGHYSLQESNQTLSEVGMK